MPSFSGVGLDLDYVVTDNWQQAGLSSVLATQPVSRQTLLTTAGWAAAKLGVARCCKKLWPCSEGFGVHGLPVFCSQPRVETAGVGCLLPLCGASHPWGFVLLSPLLLRGLLSPWASHSQGFFVCYWQNSRTDGTLPEMACAEASLKSTPLNIEHPPHTEVLMSYIL